MNNKKDSTQPNNIESNLEYNINYLYYIIYHDVVNVQHKWKIYYKKDLYSRYNHRIPSHIPSWKIYDTNDLVSELPDEITPMQVIEPPAGYEVTKNTKIKYLELYPEFITYVDEFIGELDNTGRFKHEGTYLINYFRENGYDDGITQFYEERFEIRDGNIIKIYGDFVAFYELTVQELRDRYMELQMREDGTI